MGKKYYLDIVLQGFLRWRKAAFPFRLTVLLLVLGAIIAEYSIMPRFSPVINNLVGIAIQAIRYRSEPQVTYQNLHYMEARENVRLQKQLRAQKVVVLDAPTIKALNCRPSRADFNVLYEAAQKAEIIPASRSLRDVKRDYLAQSVALTKQEFGGQWDALEESIYARPSPLTWEFWGSGLSNARFYLMVILPYPLSAGVCWFVLCICFAFLATYRIEPGYIAAAVILPIIFTAIWFVPLRYYSYGEAFMRYLYYLCLAAAAGILGYRLRRKCVAADRQPLGMLVVLTVASLVMMNGYIFYENGFNRFYSVSPTVSDYHVVHIMQIIGVVLMVAVLLLLFRKKNCLQNKKCGAE